MSDPKNIVAALIHKLMSSGGWKEHGVCSPNGGRFRHEDSDHDVVVVRIPKGAQVHIVFPTVRLGPEEAPTIDGQNVTIVPVPRNVVKSLLAPAFGPANDPPTLVDASAYQPCDCGADCHFKGEHEDQPCWGVVGSDEGQMAHVCVGHRQQNAYVPRPQLN